MIYIVSGFVRSGTSMMMQALINAGMDAAYDSFRDRMNDKLGDEYYQPNTGGFFEIGLKKYNEVGFPLSYDGKLIKVLCWGLSNCCTHKYKVIYMLRNFEEIRQSYEAFTKNKLWLKTNEEYHVLMEKHISLLENRKDTDVEVLQFRDIVKDPRPLFEKLKRRGWPINVTKCIQVIDKNQVRFKSEELDAGISNI